MKNMEYPLSQNLRLFTWHFLKPYKYTVMLYVCIAILAGCWGPFNSTLIKNIINTATSVELENMSLLTLPAILLVLNFIMFDNFTWRTIDFLNYKYQPIIKNKIISETFQFVLGSSYQFFQVNLSGRFSSLIHTLAENIEQILHRSSIDFIRGSSLL